MGTYLNACTGEKLQITKAFDGDGTLEGKLTTSLAGNPVTLDVSGRFHFFKSEGPATTISFLALNAGPPNIYEAWSLTGDAQNYPTLTGFGGRAIIEANNSKVTTCVLQGPFVRQ